MPTPEELAAAAAAPKDPPPKVPADQKYTVKVDGQDREVTLDELTSNFSLAAASNKRMEDAANIRKAAENDTVLAGYMRQVADENLSADERRAASYQMYDRLGKSRAEVDEYYKTVTAPAAAADDDDSPATDQITTEDLSPEVRAKLEKLDEIEATQIASQQAAKNEEVRDKIYKQTQERVIEDPILKVKLQGGEAEAKKIQRYVKEQVELRVGLRGQQWPGVLDEIILDARDHFKDSGNRSSDDDEITDIGAALGASPSLMPTLRSPTAPEAVDMSDRDAYSKNVSQRLAWGIAQAEKAKRKRS